MRIDRCGGSIMAGNGIWNKAFISLFCVNGLISLSQMMMNVLIALFADELGADISLVGFAVSSFAYTALALMIIPIALAFAFVILFKKRIDAADRRPEEG